MDEIKDVVVDSTIDAVSNDVCSIKKASKVLLPVAAVVGVVVIVLAFMKRKDAKKVEVELPEVKKDPEVKDPGQE